MATINSLIIAPFMEMLHYVASFIPTLVSVFVMLVLGMVVAKFLHKGLLRILKELRIDNVSDTLGLSDILHKGGIKHKLSNLISSLVYVIVVIIFLVMAVKALGITTMSALFGYLVVYIHHVITAVFVLVLGMILAKMVGSIIYLVAHHMGLPKPKLHERIGRWAIVLYAGKISLEELGFGGLLFVGTTSHILFAGIVLALALAFGLGGKDAAAGYLNKKK